MLWNQCLRCEEATTVSFQVSWPEHCFLGQSGEWDLKYEGSGGLPLGHERRDDGLKANGTE